MPRYEFYDVEILFRNDGEIYGRESYKVMAQDEDGAERKALKNAGGSRYDDDRIPDRRIVVGTCVLA
jgi:hypothetical protein